MKHSRPDPLAFLGEELDGLAERGLLREPTVVPADALSFCSNDYLGLAEWAVPPSASGSGASRLIFGDRTEHTKLEQAFARWLELDAALAFTSGWAANVGVLSALVRSQDHVVSDALNHASIIDGIRLARPNLTLVRHLDLDAIEASLQASTAERRWVVVESYYSMDADGPDLRALRKICDRHHAALIVDEAHALGVLGPGGRGRCIEAGVRPDVLVGTLGKAFGAQGALVAGSPDLRAWLWNRSRSFVFSTGLSPALAASATRSLGWLRENPDAPQRVRDLAEHLRSSLRRELPRLPVLGFGHVVPIVVGDPDRAMWLAQELRMNGLLVQAIRPPTVPDGTSRLRLTVTARHTEADVDRAVGLFAKVWRGLA